MSHIWLFCVTVLVLVKHITAPKPPVHKERTHPSYTLAKVMSKPKYKNMGDHHLGQDYIEQYQEMMKQSQESFESFNKRDVRRLRSVIGVDDLALMAEAGGLPRRRGASKYRQESVVGRRRARSQVIRRNKLNIQGLKSHKRHTKTTNFDYK